MAAWHAQGDGLDVRVRVTPKGGRDGFDGAAALADGRDVLKVRVRVAAEDGAANAAVARLLAQACGIPASQVRLTSGARMRVKTFHLAGSPERLETALHALLDAARGGS